MFLLCVKVKSSVYSAKEHLIESVTTALSICLSTIKIYIDHRMQNTVFPKSKFCRVEYSIVIDLDLNPTSLVLSPPSYDPLWYQYMMMSRGHTAFHAMQFFPIL